MTIHDSRALPGRPDRTVRVRQVDVRPQALQADRSDVVGWLPRARVGRRERPVVDGRRVCGAALRGRAAAGPREADGRRCDQRPAGGAQAARCTRARVPRAPGRDRPGSARARLPRRNRSRPDRDFGPHVIRNQRSQLHRSLRGLGREGFRHVHVLKSQEEVDAAVIERQPLWNNRKRETGPFDIIGDVHGCCDELEQLLQQLGYARNDGGPGHTRQAARRSSSAISSTAARASSTRSRR